MRKKHPIRRFITLLLLLAMVAGLAALPLLAEKNAAEENRASILTGVPQRRTMEQTLTSWGPLLSQDSTEVSVSDLVRVTEYLVQAGDFVDEGTPIARVDDVSVMTAIKSVQDTLDTLSGQLKTVRAKISSGAVTVDDSGRLCVDGKPIEESKLSYYVQFWELTEQYNTYEDLLLELFLLHRDGTVNAPCSGIIGDLDKTQLQPLGFSSNGLTLMPLARNTPDGDDSTFYRCYTQWITGVTDAGMWTVKWCMVPFIVTDFLKTDGVNTSFISEEGEWYPETVFSYGNGKWTTYTPQVGDILMYALDENQNYWVIRIGYQAVPTPEVPSTEPSADPQTPGEDPSTDSTESTESTTPTDPTRPGDSGGSGSSGSRPASGGISMPSFSGSSRSGSGTSAQSITLCSTSRNRLCTVTPDETMHIVLSIDESDITRLQVGMEVGITLEALPNRSFTAIITAVSPFGTNNGGSSKFAVTAELPRDADMLPGMNAHATIVLESIPDCLTVPVAALQDQGTGSVICTGLDEKTGLPANPVELTIGITDGEYVQVLSGLEDGIPFFYSYYDTFEISTAVETVSAFG